MQLESDNKAEHEPSQEKSADEIVKEKTGFEARDILYSPLKAPELKDKRGPSPKQHLIILSGLALAIIGVLALLILGGIVPIIIIIIGSCLVLFGTLIKL